jgi:AraC-like DNA-binding protein
VKTTASLDAFVADPVGRALVGPSWTYFCAAPELYGIALRGRPNREDIERLTRVLVIELGDAAVPHQSLVDASRVTGVDAGAYDALDGYVREHRDALAVAVTRLALVRPRGMPGAVTAGFYEVVDPPYPTEVFETLELALDWLAPAAALRAEIAAVVATGDGDPLLVQLRAALRERLGGEVELDAIAGDLGVSGRTLQRRLRERDTSFRGELAAARIDEAKRLLRDTGAPITRIALDVGFASAQHLSTAFREAVGVSPSDWRARR